MNWVACIIIVLALAACSAPITQGPRSLNDALLNAHEDSSEVMPE